jgi:hypothetical protein
LDAFGHAGIENCGVQALAGRGLALRQLLAGAAGNADVKCDSHRAFLNRQQEAMRR